MLALIAWSAAGFSAVLVTLAVVATFVEIPRLSAEARKVTSLEWIGVLAICGFLALMTLT